MRTLEAARYAKAREFLNAVPVVTRSAPPLEWYDHFSISCPIGHPLDISTGIWTRKLGTYTERRTQVIIIVGGCWVIGEAPAYPIGAETP